MRRAQDECAETYPMKSFDMVAGGGWCGVLVEGQVSNSMRGVGSEWQWSGFLAEMDGMMAGRCAGLRCVGCGELQGWGHQTLDTCPAPELARPWGGGGAT